MAQRWQTGFDHTLRYEAFVYLWYDSHNRKYYLGYHKGSVQDRYTHSSARMPKFHMSDIPPGFRRRILCVGSHNYCFFRERDLLKLRLGSRRFINPKYYNCYVKSPKGGSKKGRLFSQSHREAISKANRGRKISPEWRKALSIAGMGRQIPEQWGGKCKFAKLTESEAKQIKYAVRTPRTRPVALAERFGVSIDTVYSIWRNDTWRHI